MKPSSDTGDWKKQSAPVALSIPRRGERFAARVSLGEVGGRREKQRAPVALSIPRRGGVFFHASHGRCRRTGMSCVSIPRRGGVFFHGASARASGEARWFQSPGGEGFFPRAHARAGAVFRASDVSIPRRGGVFFHGAECTGLAGIRKPFQSPGGEGFFPRLDHIVDVVVNAVPVSIPRRGGVFPRDKVARLIFRCFQFQSPGGEGFFPQDSGGGGDATGSPTRFNPPEGRGFFH